jgi:hypothetical protein
MARRNNTTTFTTKSGTKVYVVGDYVDQPVRDRAGNKFVAYFNRDFTIAEQRQIGNIYYDLYDKYHNTCPHDNMKKNNWVGKTSTFVGKEVNELNPRRKKMVDVTFTPDARNDESAVTHEMIHAMKFMEGIPGKKHNERKIDFEMIGRISRDGIKNMQFGYYLSPKGNPYLAKKRGVTLEEKGRIAQEGLFEDRRLLTGSLSKRVIGKPIENKSDELFRKSFFFKKV